MTTAAQPSLRLLWLSTFLSVALAAILSSNCPGQDDVPAGPAKAVEQLRGKAAAGDAGAMYELGMDYQRGKLVELDLTLARQWLEKAANAGSTRAMDRLWTMYFTADGGVALDHATALRWAQAEADAGAPMGLLSLGTSLEKGHGVVKDADRAHGLYAEASVAAERDAKTGDDASMHALGWIYLEGLGIRQDYTQAAKWYQKAAEAGDTNAMVWAGRIQAQGLGVQKDYAAAMTWFRKAGDMGDAIAMRCVGDLYKGGLGVEKDWARALSWYQNSARAGSALAMTKIGHLYEDGGPGLKADGQQALAWYQRAADAGLPDAMTQVAFCFRYGVGTEKDLGKAKELYRKAADAGDASAMCSLGNISEYESKDLGEARRWYQKAADAGFEGATKWLSEHGRDQFLVIGAGLDAKATAISTERDIASVAKRAKPAIPVDILFCDGDAKANVVRVKSKLTPDQQVVADVFIASRSERFSDSYRPADLPNGFHAATQFGVAQALWRAADKMERGDRLFVCVMGHGTRGNDRAHNTGFSLWRENPMSVDDLSTVLARPLRRGNAVLVMNQCYAGGFADLIFDPPTDDTKPAERCPCGFFATPAEEQAAGCTSDPNSPAFRDYSSYFFAALFGTDEDGKAVSLQDVDFDHDGKVSLREAHAYALIHEDNQDLPVTTSDVFLRRFSRKRDLGSFFLVSPSAPRERLLELATPDQAAVITGLLEQLGLPGRNIESEALDYQDAVAKKIEAEHRVIKDEILPELSKVRSAIQSDISRDTLVPLKVDVPPTEEDIKNLLAESKRLSAVAEAVRKHKDYARMEDLDRKFTKELVKIDALQCDGTKARRLGYVADSVVLRANFENVLVLDHVGDETTVNLYKKRFDELIAAENESLNEAVRR